MMVGKHNTGKIPDRGAARRGSVEKRKRDAWLDKGGLISNCIRAAGFVLSLCHSLWPIGEGLVQLEKQKEIVDPYRLE